MFRSEVPCTGCNDSHFIQNKKKHLCSNCVFKLNHGGKTQQEVYSERSRERDIKAIVELRPVFKANAIDLNYIQDEESLKNERNQNLAEQQEKDDLKELNRIWGGDKGGQYEILHKNSIKERAKKNPPHVKKKVQKAIKKLSLEQAEIERKYKATCIDMDHVTEPICTGCGRYQGGDIRLSHSHIISRKECKEIGKPELIYERENLEYLCMDFGENEGCHRIWENPKRRHELQCYTNNLEIIKRLAPEILSKYKSI